eukprot:TRINITY_DN69057_c0_g1_i1.p1 TRINITY_DN69057_c0_g1~~TRINITY_DN69057_c0_g1_i1.p1  ORF type:complete len:162 (-),score=43.20 TRINITY_DN69057_c0_g1_i1:19-456(-)
MSLLCHQVACFEDPLVCLRAPAACPKALPDDAAVGWGSLPSRGKAGTSFLVEAAPALSTSGRRAAQVSAWWSTSFSGHGHGHEAHQDLSAEAALAQAESGLKTCALGFLASSAALLSAYVSWSLEKDEFDEKVEEHERRHGRSAG